MVAVDVAGTLSVGGGGRAFPGTSAQDAGSGYLVAVPDVSHCLNAGGMGRQDFESETLVTHALRGEGFDASEDGTGRGTPIVAVHGTQDPDVLCDMAHTLDRNNGAENAVFSIMPMNSGRDYKAREVDVAQPIMTSPVGGNQGGDYVVSPVAFDTTQITSAANFSNPRSGDPCHPLAAGAHAPAVAFALRGREDGAQAEIHGDGQLVGALRSASGGATRDMIATTAVRRLTPRECERLQGFPDDFTAIPWRGKGTDQCPDGPRYKALGNSMAVPVMAWIGRRIQMVEDIKSLVIPVGVEPTTS